MLFIRLMSWAHAKRLFLLIILNEAGLTGQKLAQRLNKKENQMSEVKYRNMGIQILLIVATLGIYGIYWFYQSATELKFVAKDAEASPTLWTILLFVPFANIKKKMSSNTAF